MVCTVDGDACRCVPLSRHPEFLETAATWIHGHWGVLAPDSSLLGVMEKLRGFLNTGCLPMCVLTLRQDEPVGVYNLMSYEIADRPELTPWLSSVYVAPDWRGRGIGSAMALDALQRARALGVETLYLFTPDRQRLYSRLGWEAMEDVLCRGEQVTIMRRGTAVGPDEVE